MCETLRRKHKQDLVPEWDRAMKIKNRCIQMLSHQYTVDLWMMTAKFKLNIQGIMSCDVFTPWPGATLDGALQHSEPSGKVARKGHQRTWAKRRQKEEQVERHRCKWSRNMGDHLLVETGVWLERWAEESVAAGLPRSWWNLSFRAPPFP